MFWLHRRLYAAPIYVPCAQFCNGGREGKGILLHPSQANGNANSTMRRKDSNPFKILGHFYQQPKGGREK